MKIEKIRISNFRNIEKADLIPGKKINFIIGDNAQGKTNLIESLYYSAFLKSFRTNKNSDVIKENENESFIKLDVEKNNVINNLYLKIDKSKKELRVNNKKPEHDKFYNYINIIIFHPDEVNYISSYPLFRRNLIDRSIFYKNYKYLDVYSRYSKCLKQRNNYLKNLNNKIDCWKDQLIDLGSKIICERIKYINELNDIFSSNDFITKNKEKYSIVYNKKFSNLESIREILEEEFTDKKEREKVLGHTLVGPHKDDFIFLLNNKPAEVFASQGQKRSKVISFKAAQIINYRAVHGESPVLILDDMTSELDLKRNNALLENLLENSGQVFITSTDLKCNNISEQATVFSVNQGEISLAD